MLSGFSRGFCRLGLAPWRAAAAPSLLLPRLTAAVAAPSSRSFALLAAAAPSPSSSALRRRPLVATMLAPPGVTTPMLGAPAAVMLQARFLKPVGRRRAKINFGFGKRRRLAGQKKQTKNTPRSGRGTGVWWQPLLPAMAKDRCDHMLPKPKPGSGRNGKRARALVREQQKIWTHAVRIEGTRRARIYKQAKIEREGDRVKAVYREFADILRARALSQKAAEDAAGATTVSGSSSSSDAPPAA